MHESWQDMLPLYVNDGLTPEERQALEAHLADCEECRARLWGFRMLAQAVAEEAEADALKDTLPPLMLPLNSHTPQNREHRKWRRKNMFISVNRPMTDQPTGQAYGIFAPLKRLMAALVVDPEEGRRSTSLTFAVTIAMMILVMSVMISIYVSQYDDDTLSLAPVIEQEQAGEVDCLADRAYRVVYPEELESLTTEDLKCAFIVGDLRDVDISHLDFSETVMRDVNMSGMALEGMRFNRAVMVNADLNGASLSSSVFNAASLPNANLSLTDLSGAWFLDANLVGASFAGANLSNAVMGNANLKDADFSCADDLVEDSAQDDPALCENPANLDTADLGNASLVRADLSHANLNDVEMSRSNLSDANLQYANLYRGRLNYSILDSANLQNADLTATALLGAILTGTNLQDANLNKGVMPGAVIINANLENTNLTNADLLRSDLFPVTFIGSDLTGVDLTGAAFGDVIWTDVTLPDGTVWTEEIDLTRFTDPDHVDYWRSDDEESPAFGDE